MRWHFSVCSVSSRIPALYNVLILSFTVTCNITPPPPVYSSNCLNHESHLRFVITHLLVQISQIFEPVSDNLTQITFAWLAAQIEEATEVNLWWQPVNLICSLFKNLLHPKKTICYQAVTFWPMVSQKDTKACQNEICQESKP